MSTKQTPAISDLTTPQLIRALRETDPRLYTELRVGGVDCVSLTDEAVDLCQARGLSVESDAYGCDFCVEAADDNVDPRRYGVEDE